MEFLCNVVLLVPFAVLGSLALPRWSWRDWTAWGFLLAGAVELTQGLLLPGRDASYADVVANTLGALLGAWLVVAGAVPGRPAATPDLESWTCVSIMRDAHSWPGARRPTLDACPRPG